MKKILKLFAASLLVIVVIFAVVQCLDTDTDDLPDDDVKQGDLPDDDVKQPEDENKITFSVDHEVQTSDTWKMTYKGCQIKDKLDLSTTAEDGTEYVIVFFELENLSEESQYFNTAYSGFYIDGFKTGQLLYSLSIDHSMQLVIGNSVEAGRKLNGYFLFHETSGWEELEIIYDDDIFHENEENVMRFTITKNP